MLIPKSSKLQLSGYRPGTTCPPSSNEVTPTAPHPPGQLEGGQSENHDAQLKQGPEGLYTSQDSSFLLDTVQATNVKPRDSIPRTAGETRTQACWKPASPLEHLH